VDAVGVRMPWQEDERVWEHLDRVAEESWPAVKDFLDVLAEHNDEISAVGQALMFAGIGRFLASYRRARQEGMPADEALSEAVRQVHGDNRIQAMMQGAVHQLIDNKVGEVMNGSSE